MQNANADPEGNNPATPPAASGLEQANRRYREGIENYLHALSDVHMNLSRAWEEAQRNCTKSIQSLQERTQSRLQELIRDTGKSVESVVAQPDAQTRYLDSQRKYTDEMSLLYDEYQKGAADANHQLVAALGQVLKERENASREAFRNYLQSVQEAWALVDVNALVGRR